MIRAQQRREIEQQEFLEQLEGEVLVAADAAEDGSRFLLLLSAKLLAHIIIVGGSAPAQDSENPADIFFAAAMDRIATFRRIDEETEMLIGKLSVRLLKLGLSSGVEDRYRQAQREKERVLYNGRAATDEVDMLK